MPQKKRVQFSNVSALRRVGSSSTALVRTRSGNHGPRRYARSRTRKTSSDGGRAAHPYDRPHFDRWEVWVENGDVDVHRATTTPGSSLDDAFRSMAARARLDALRARINAVKRRQ